LLLSWRKYRYFILLVFNFSVVDVFH